MKNNPMSERRAALDLAIVALDRYRSWVKQNYHSSSPDIEEERINNINQAIKILTSMKDEGPLL